MMIKKYVAAAMASGLGVLLCGCGAAPVPSTDVYVTNTSAWDCTLTVSIDGQEREINVGSGKSVTESLDHCATTVALVNQTLGTGGASETTSFSGEAGSTLSVGTNFACGDRIVVEITPSETRLKTEAAG